MDKLTSQERKVKSKVYNEGAVDDVGNKVCGMHNKGEQKERLNIFLIIVEKLRVSKS